MRREYKELYFIAFSLHLLVIVLVCGAYASVSLQIFLIGWSTAENRWANLVALGCAGAGAGVFVRTGS